MKTQTQQQKLLKLLKEAGNSGLNSFDATYIHGIKQAPTRKDELIKQGYSITSSPMLPNRSVNWILDFIPEDKKTKKFIGFEGNNALYIYE